LERVKDIESVQIRCVVTQLDDLVTQIPYDQTRRYRGKIDEALLISVFQERLHPDEEPGSSIDHQFVYSQIFIDYLFGIKSISTGKAPLVEFLKNECQGNEKMLAKIDEFNRDYTPDRSLWWYTQDSFLYRLLNKALRKKNLSVLLLFRFFVRDIDNELEKHRCSTSMRVFRSQCIPSKQLSILKESVGKLISVNSFLWTNLIRKSALSNLKEFSWIEQDMSRVLFEIDIDPRCTPRKAFANVTPFSYFKGEQEILFMLGSIFRLVELSVDGNQVWIARLTLCNDQQEELKNIEHFQHLRQNRNELDPLAFGHLLMEMKIFDQAEKYFSHLLDGLADDEPKMIVCYDALGQIAAENEEYDASVRWYHKALEMKKRTVPSNDPSMAFSYNSLAVVHMKTSDYTRAIESYRMALSILTEVLDEDDPQTSICRNNLALVCKMDKNYAEALHLYEQNLRVHEKYLSADHPDVAMSLTNIAMIYAHLALYDRALDYYHRAIDIYERILTTPHSLLGMIYENIGNILNDKHDLDEAFDAYQKASSIYQSLLPFTHCDLLQIQMIIKRILSKLKPTLRRH
jgi:tetratricopeptide (TPR) repeat protein